MQNIIGKVRFDAQTKITNGNFVNLNYSQNPEYIKMLTDGNFIDVTEEQYQFIRSNNNNGIEVCVIDGKLQVYVTPDSIKLEKAKVRKLSVLQSFYSSNKTWECTLKNTTNSITKTKDWFCINLSPSMEFETDQKTIITITIPPDKYFVILNLLSAFGTKVFNVNKDLQNKINLATKVADIDAINIEAEFAKINKIIIVA